MDEAGTWQGRIGLSTGEFVLDGDPAPFPKFNKRNFISPITF